MNDSLVYPVCDGLAAYFGYYLTEILRRDEEQVSIVPYRMFSRPVCRKFFYKSAVDVLAS